MNSRADRKSDILDVMLGIALLLPLLLFGAVIASMYQHRPIHAAFIQAELAQLNPQVRAETSKLLWSRAYGLAGDPITLAELRRAETGAKNALADQQR